MSLEALPGEELGQLSHVAMTVVMQVFYGARQARWDLKAVAILSTRFTGWYQVCDPALHGMMSCMSYSPDLVLRGRLAIALTS